MGYLAEMSLLRRFLYGTIRGDHFASVDEFMGVVDVPIDLTGDIGYVQVKCNTSEEGLSTTTT